MLLCQMCEQFFNALITGATLHRVSVNMLKQGELGIQQYREHFQHMF
jgi:hypothetical protein